MSKNAHKDVLEKKLKAMNGLSSTCMHEAILKHLLFNHTASLKCYTVVCLDNMIYKEFS